MIKSNLEVVNQIVIEMEGASDLVETGASKTISKAEKTTLNINEKAQDANEELIKLASLFNQAFRETIKNIHLVAEEFDQKDHELKEDIEQLPATENYFKGVRTYE